MRAALLVCVLVGCGGTAAPGELELPVGGAPGRAGSGGSAAGAQAAAGEPGSAGSSVDVGGAGGLATGAAGGTAGSSAGGPESGGMPAGSAGDRPWGGAPTGGLPAAGSGGVSALAGMGGMSPSAGSSSGGAPGTPPAADCPNVSGCDYRPAFNVGSCSVTASYCDEPITARCWKFSVKPYVSGFKETASPLCALGYSANCAAADAAIDAYCIAQ